MALLQSALGLLSFVALAWLLSENRSRVSGKVILIGIGGQLLVGLIMFRLPLFQQAFIALNSVVLVFGYLGGGPLPFEAKAPGNLFILGFRALPLVLVVSALSSLFFYWRILPWLVRGFAWCLTKTLGIGGTEGLAVAANVFVGMVEAPLLIRHYLRAMSRGELFAVVETLLRNLSQLGNGSQRESAQGGAGIQAAALRALAGR